MDFIVLIDALRHDFIDAETTPFLHQLRSQSECATVVETYAFQTRPAFFAGLKPDESGVCHLFKYAPESSPFAFLRPFQQALRAFDPYGDRRFGRGILKRIARRNLRARGHDAAADVLGTERIPMHLLPFFAPSETDYTDAEGAFPGYTTLFDELRSHGKTWSWTGYPKHFGSSASISSAFHKSPPADVAYLHFSELDWTGHKYGPTSEEMRRARTEVDESVRLIVEPELAHGARVVIFGDHGMVEVKYRIDLEGALRKLDLVNGTDYVAFLDSTMARFWFLTDCAEGVIRETLVQLEGGRILSEAERVELGISKRSHGLGDLVFAVDGPGIVHPSFFERSPSGPKGMHGYLPSQLDNRTSIVLYPATPKDLGTIEMTTMRALMSRHLIG